MSPAWQVVVVRAWRQGSRRIIRLTMSSGTDPVPRTAYATSARSAAEHLARWLDERAADPPTVGGGDPSAGGTDESCRAQEDDA